MTPVLVLLVAWLAGGIPFGFLLVRLRSGRDVRTMGSGNIGATNVLRTAGGLLGVLTLLLDIGKGTFAVWLSDIVTKGDVFWMSLTALAVMAGHAFPLFLRFRGGKAVASFIGAFLYLTPVPLLATLLIFVITVAASRYISLGSIVAAALFPLSVWLIEHPPAFVLAAATLAGVFIIYRHWSNILRIGAGNENVFSLARRQVR
ncbi:MAG: glycerol-3-phosphate 1-O-acyltransferase PlsY [Bryobacteraceae bacterium]|nr:glycerol-3-phosphate 1-O-acyltransferase PlsY [Bryobacteraceae bacterium]